MVDEVGRVVVDAACGLARVAHRYHSEHDEEGACHQRVLAPPARPSPMEPCCSSPQVQGHHEEAHKHKPDQADVLPRIHAAQRYLRPLTLPEDQSDLGYQIGVGRDYVENREQSREAEGAHSELAQRLHRLYGEAQLVDEVSRRGDAQYGYPEHQQIEDPRLATEHDGVESLGRALANTLEVTVADDRLHDQEPEAPEKAEVS